MVMSGPEILVIDNAISTDDCAYLADPPDTAIVPTLTIGALGSRRSYRQVCLDLTDPRMARILDTHSQLVAAVSAEHYPRTKPEIVNHALLRYGPGDYLAAHCDNQDEGTVRRGTRWGDQPAPRIPFGCNLYLDSPDQYGGGDLLADDYEPIRPYRGALVLIRGDIRHRVTEVSRGRRRVLKTLVITSKRRPR